MSTEPAWHALPAAEVERLWGGDGRGLSPHEVQARRQEHGANRLPAPPRRRLWRRALAQFNNPLIHVLLAAAAVSACLGHAVDALVIGAVLLLNALVGLIQEGRAEQALEAIRRLIDPQAAVIRQGQRCLVPAEELVPGDRVLLAAGDRVPADLRLLACHQLRIDESLLTGESLTVAKHVEAVALQAPLAERRCLAYSGTMVAAGSGTGLVVATGERTELGRIGRLLGSVVSLQTPLTRQMEGFATQVTTAILMASLGLFGLAVWGRGYAWDEAFMVVVGLAVAAIPEGLPAVVTITMAVGVQRMAQRRAIIRHLPAVEALGAVSVICADKTGTLTCNEMMVQAAELSTGHVEIGGAGYEPVGSVRFEQASHDARISLHRLALAAALCNDAELQQRHGSWCAQGDPLEAALLVLAAKVGLDVAALRQAWPRLAEIPFDGQRRDMTTLHRRPEGQEWILVKGAPERVFSLVAHEAHGAGQRLFDLVAWTRRTHRLASQGLRVLAVASGERDEASLGALERPSGLTLLGLVGLIDPPRTGARLAIAGCRRAGIQVKMITGDHAVTAEAIARQLGLSEHPRVVEGQQLDAREETDLAELARTSEVFARTTPEHKLRLVQALQSTGAIVAMTGDGVNDAPALKRADVGVAMGARGTEVAKQAAHVVLADDNFATIVAAVQEGRTVYDNITKVIAWTLPANGGEAFAIIGALLVGLPLPVTPLQILWINLITAVALGLTLAFEPPAGETMSRPPRLPGAPLLTPRLGRQTLLLCGLFSVGVFAVYLWEISRGHDLSWARTAVVHALVWMEIGFLLSVRLSPRQPLRPADLLATPVVRCGVLGVLLCQLAFLYLPLFQQAFATRPLGAQDWLVCWLTGLAVFAVVEWEKRRLGCI
ncbi:MAG: HAD-IC family P-type ATPase [Candidatus Sericytochromatia bacterium]|nr:HAD-IC family P-type ATPase [Candidatus Sericytochromatia bacterium]